MIKPEVQWLQRNGLTRLQYDARYRYPANANPISSVTYGNLIGNVLGLYVHSQIKNAVMRVCAGTEKTRLCLLDRPNIQNAI